MGQEYWHASLSRRYLAFLWLAFNDKAGRFRNFLGYDREWQEEIGSEDSHGRALWAVGTVLGHSDDASLRGAAGRLFEAAFPAALTFTSPRAWAFSILGMQEYLDWFPGDRVIQGARNALADLLLDIYERSHSKTWQWFEKSLSYSNARLPQALMLAGWRSENQRMIEVGVRHSSGSLRSNTETTATSSCLSVPEDSAQRMAKRPALTSNPLRLVPPSPHVFRHTA